MTSHANKTRPWLRRLLVPVGFAPPEDLTGKHIIVTGASSGSLGLATAQTLAQWGATVVITSRTLAAVQQAANELPIEGNGRLIPAALDLCQAASVDAFAREYKEQHGSKLDVLINNAGIHLDLLSRWKTPRLTGDGYELHWRTNYLGTFHLTELLLPLLLETARETGDARVVNVVSQLHYKGRNEDFFKPDCRYNSWVAYGTSKLALVHMTQDIHNRHAHEGLTACSLHPGAVYSQVATKGLSEAPLLSKIRNALAPLEKAFMFNTEEGAQTSIFCATSETAREGGYYRRMRKVAASPAAADADFTRKLRDQSLQAIKDY